jgi:hypothetical protein
MEIERIGVVTMMLAVTRFEFASLSAILIGSNLRRQVYSCCLVVGLEVFLVLSRKN